MTRKLSEEATVRKFMDVARSYCSAIDSHAESQLRAFLEQLELLLPQLVAGVLSLPDVQRFGPAPPEFDHRKTWKPVCDCLAEYLGEQRRYWTVFDPTKPTKDDPVVGDLADDLADVYCDLRRGLDAWEAADAASRLEIIWTWRFDYESHWGQHAVDALRAIYSHLGMLKLGRSTDPAHVQEAGHDA